MSEGFADKAVNNTEIMRGCAPFLPCASSLCTVFRFELRVPKESRGHAAEAGHEFGMAAASKLHVGLLSTAIRLNRRKVSGVSCTRGATSAAVVRLLRECSRTSRQSTNRFISVQLAAVLQYSCAGYKAPTSKCLVLYTGLQLTSQDSKESILSKNNDD